MPSSHLILCHPLLLLPPIPPSTRVFSNELTLSMRWPKYWSFSFSISPSKEHPGLISFRIDWLNLLAVQGTLKSLLQHHSSKASILQCSAFFPWGRKESDTTEWLHFLSLFSFLYSPTFTPIHDYWKNHSFDSVSQSVQSLSHVSLFATPWTAAHQASLVHQQLSELIQTHVHWVGDAIQPSHSLSSPSPPTFNLSQHQGVFQWVSSLHQVAKVLELQLQHQSFQWILRTDFLEDWLVWTPHCPRDSRVFSSTTIWNHQFFGSQSS